MHDWYCILGENSIRVDGVLGSFSISTLFVYIPSKVLWWAHARMQCWSFYTLLGIICIQTLKIQAFLIVGLDSVAPNLLDFCSLDVVLDIFAQLTI